MDLVHQPDRALPTNPTAADTSDWYRLGDATEKHGRHMKRQAIAAEYNSGRNMEAWYREVGLNERSGRYLVQEAKELSLIGTVVPNPQLSESMPTRDAALEYAKAEPEIREVIKEIIKEDPDKEIKAAEIKRLRQELAESRRQVEVAQVAAERAKSKERSPDSSAANLVSDVQTFGAQLALFKNRLGAYLASRGAITPDLTDPIDAQLEVIIGMITSSTVNVTSPATIQIIDI